MMMNVIKNFLIPVFLMVFLSGAAQSMRFEHLTSADGISQSEVYAFLKDSRGFVWFGTLDGLNRYDGNDIEIFNTRKGDPHALSNNTIRCLEEDQYGRVWIGTDDGLNFYDPKTELINQVQVVSFEERFTVWSLLVVEDFLLVGSDKGLWRASLNTEKQEDIETDFRKVEGISKNTNLDVTVRSLRKSANGGIWVVTPNHVSRLVFLENKTDPVIINDVSFSDYSAQIAAAEDFTGNLWIVSSTEGLIRYNPDSDHVKTFRNIDLPFTPSSLNLSALAVDTSGNLWIGTQDNGINLIQADLLNGDKIDFQYIQNIPGNTSSLNSNLIYSLYISEENQVWIGTIGSGVNIYDPEQKQFEHYKFYDTKDAPSSNFIRSVYVNDQNNILTGTHNNGLFLLIRKNREFRKLGFKNEAIFYIANHEENKYFICTEGLFLVELVNNELRIISRSDYNPDNAVFYIERSKPGVYWYASLTGLVRMTVVNDKMVINEAYSTYTSPRLSANNIRVLHYENSTNELYIGTEGGGLDIFSLDADHYPTDVRVYRKSEQSNSISNNYIRSIIKDSHQNIWIGTYEGLNRLVRDSVSGEISFISYTRDDGLPNNMIQSIVEDDDSCLWIGTNGGLSKFYPEKEQFVNYNADDGLQSNEFSEHTVYKKSDGEIIMGGINGINAFYPEQIKPSLIQPKTTITDFYLFNNLVTPGEKVGRNVPLEKSIVLTDSIRLLPKQRNFGFAFSSMILPNAKNTKYEYTLEGFSDRWHSTDATNRIVNYTNLSYGEYTFKVRSSNSDGIWDTPREVYIQIVKPFWFTWAAYFIYVVLVFLMLFYFSHFTIIRYTTKRELVLEKEHNEKLHELDELRTKFFINISHDLRTPLTLISGPLEKLLQNQNLSRDVKSKLELIARNVKRLSYLVEQLLDIRKAESGKLTPKLISRDIISFAKEEAAHFSYAVKKKGLQLKIHSDTDQLVTSFDPGMLSKVFFNIISNAIKYTDMGQIEIVINKVSKETSELVHGGTIDFFIKVEIRDTGKGMDSEKQHKIFNRFYQDTDQSLPGYGIGLSHAKELIDAHGGFIEVDSRKGVGTTIRFFLPFIEKSLESQTRITSSEDIYITENETYKSTSDGEIKSKKSILVVEDNEDMLNFIAEELKGTYNVYKASDGVEGLAIAESKSLDLIISDVMMANMDGVEFCEKVKSNVKISHIPVILLTAKSDVETKFKGIESGADDFISKPFEIEYLLLRIKNILHAREELRRQFQSNQIFEPSAIRVTSVDEKFLLTLKDEIEKEMSSPGFSINSLEVKMGMSHANFYRKIKSLTGQSGQELLQSMRMKRSHQILSENKGIRISEVAYMVGFTNPKYFSKCFKEMFGYAPTKLKED